MARSGKEEPAARPAGPAPITATGWREPNRLVCASVAYIHPNLFPARLFQFADIQRTVVIQAGTVVLDW